MKPVSKVVIKHQAFGHKIEWQSSGQKLVEADFKLFLSVLTGFYLDDGHYIL